MDLVHHVQLFWKQHFSALNISNTHLILAVSGGVDSIVMTDIFIRIGFKITIAHCNFQLRGDESVRDENFVTNLAAQYRVPLLVKKIDTKKFATTNKIGTQEAARILRYDWFASIVAEDKKNYIVTAHHIDDNVETVTMNFFRGTGLKGLCGIAPLQQNKHLLRPLLCCNKSLLMEYAEKNQLPFVEDSTNASNVYTRNFFRNALLPQVKRIFATVETNIINNIERLNEAEMLYRQATEWHIKKLLRKQGDTFLIACLQLKKTQPLQTIVWEIIKQFNFATTQITEVIKLLDADTGSNICSPTHRILINRKYLIITTINNSKTAPVLIETDAKKVVFDEGTLSIKKVDGNIFSITDSPETAYLDATTLMFPLLLRKYRHGDYFYPLGMRKKKKLSRFFIDKKISQIDKECAWVLTSGEKIMWVVGYRIDDRFKVTPQTKCILKISFGANKN